MAHTSDQALRQSTEREPALKQRLEDLTCELADHGARLEAETVARVRAEEHSATMQRALECIPAAILITDIDANITFVNQRFTEMTGYNKSEVLGKKPSMLLPEGASIEEHQRMWDELASGQWSNGEFLSKRKDGSTFWSLETVRPVKESDGKTTHFVSVTEDVTDRKGVEEQSKQPNKRLADMNRTLEQRVAKRTAELQQANDRLIEAHDQMVRNEKLAAIGQISAGMAHDLRNPLGSIKNAVYYLIGKLSNSEEARGNPRIIEFLKIIDDEVGHSNRIITDLMDFARIAPPSFSPVNLQNVIADAIASLEAKDNVEIEVIRDANAPDVHIQADGSQLHRVLLNLGMNAQDAMPEGGLLTFSSREYDGYAEVAVSDTGEGIEEEAIRRIFDPLFTTKTQGTGLGLAVCQQIVSRHGGAIDVESRPGGGTTFTMRLPLLCAREGRKEV